MKTNALDEFLKGVEKRAYRTAVFAVRDEGLALDIVQEAMFRLADRYGDHPATQWPLLFARILQNAITDAHRRLKVRKAWVTLFGDLGQTRQESGEKTEPDLEAWAELAAPAGADPAEAARQSQSLEKVEKALLDLPLRQRQAFLLRYWEELDVAETAKAMGCSEGSVKTHCSRAIKALGQKLSELGPS